MNFETNISFQLTAVYVGICCGITKNNYDLVQWKPTEGNTAMIVRVGSQFGPNLVHANESVVF